MGNKKSTNLRVLAQVTDVREALEDALNRTDDFEGIIILGLCKDSSQYLATSTMSGYKKMFLVQFLSAWAMKWFRLDEPDRPS